MAQRVWDDPLHVVVLDRLENAQQRWHTIGMAGAVTVLVVVVVHAYPDDGDETLIRIIDARKATTHERENYEQQAL